MRTQKFDLVILGSGSTAFAVAIRAAELGKAVAMTENRTLGGTCVNRGCLPSKNLIAAANIIHDAAHPRYPGMRGRPVALQLFGPGPAKGRGHLLLPGQEVPEHRRRSHQRTRRFGAVCRAQRRSGGRCTSGSGPFSDCDGVAAIHPVTRGLGQNPIPDERSPHQSRRCGVSRSSPNRSRS